MALTVTHWRDTTDALMNRGNCDEPAAAAAAATMGTRRHGQGGIAPPLPRKNCSVLCISNDSKTLSRRIIYALFSKHSSASGSFAPRPPSGWGTEAPWSSNLPTHGKSCGHPWQRASDHHTTTWRLRCSRSVHIVNGHAHDLKTKLTTSSAIAEKRASNSK